MKSVVADCKDAPDLRHDAPRDRAGKVANEEFNCNKSSPQRLLLGDELVDFDFRFGSGAPVRLGRERSLASLCAGRHGRAGSWVQLTVAPRVLQRHVLAAADLQRSNLSGCSQSRAAGLRRPSKGQYRPLADIGQWQRTAPKPTLGPCSTRTGHDARVSAVTPKMSTGRSFESMFLWAGAAPSLSEERLRQQLCQRSFYTAANAAQSPAGRMAASNDRVVCCAL